MTIETSESYVNHRVRGGVAEIGALIDYIDKVLLPVVAHDNNTETLSQHPDLKIENCDDCEDWALRCDFLQEQLDDKLSVIEQMEKLVEGQNALIGRLQEEISALKRGDPITHHLGIALPVGS